MSNWLELAVHCPRNAALQFALEVPWNFIEIDPLAVGVAVPVATQVDALTCAVRADAVDAAGSTTSALAISIELTVTPIRRLSADFMTTPLRRAPDVFRPTKRRTISRAGSRSSNPRFDGCVRVQWPPCAQREDVLAELFSSYLQR